MFTLGLAVHAKGGIGLCPKARERDIRPAEMAHAIRSLVNMTERTVHLLLRGICALSYQIVERKVTITGRDVEDIGGQFGFRCWYPAGACRSRLR
ncbi:MAG: hypothetical protein QM771_09985 [Nitrospira sp.]